MASVLLKFCPSRQWSTRGALGAPVLRTQPSCNAERGSQGHSQVRAPGSSGGGLGRGSARSVGTCQPWQ